MNDRTTLRAARLSLATGLVASALFGYHAFAHRCHCGHLAHEEMWPAGGIVDGAWVALFIVSLIAARRIPGAKIVFLGLLFLLLIAGEVLQLPVLGLPVLYIYCYRKAVPRPAPTGAEAGQPAPL